ncbi:MAG TPA: hypothetical protein VES67_07270 [Vicinamibacterales bacterium]|nr:hypothetical protein [Vicinamibacterales bacterium]
MAAIIVSPPSIGSQDAVTAQDIKASLTWLTERDMSGEALLYNKSLAVKEALSGPEALDAFIIEGVSDEQGGQILRVIAETEEANNVRSLKCYLRAFNIVGVQFVVNNSNGGTGLSEPIGIECMNRRQNAVDVNYRHSLKDL